MSNFTTILPVGFALLHADKETGGRTGGRADVTNLIGAFRDYEKLPKNGFV